MGAPVMTKGELLGVIYYAQQLEQSRNEITEWNQTFQQRVYERTKELYEKNAGLGTVKKKLLSFSQQLQEIASIVIDSAVENERKRLSRDLHDSLGQLMALSTSQLEVCGNLCLTSPLEAHTKLNQITNLFVMG
jgi:signal transduction histidine kinase